MSITFRTIIVYIVCLSYVLGCLSKKHDVHVVLGSADENILGERIRKAMQYINSSDSPNILFISGGVKDAFVDTNEMTEASKAANMIENVEIDSFQIVLEEKATNTAENFAYLKQWVNRNFSQDNLPDIVITTSDFHKNRAEQIFHGIIPDIVPKWNLSKSACIHCWGDEVIHMKNVKADIHKAIHILVNK
jgi:uncharacterized SAM-binding protein YcdF (DUF218 family)